MMKSLQIFLLMLLVTVKPPPSTLWLVCHKVDGGGLPFSNRLTFHAVFRLTFHAVFRNRQRVGTLFRSELDSDPVSLADLDPVGMKAAHQASDPWCRDLAP